MWSYAASNFLVSKQCVYRPLPGAGIQFGLFTRGWPNDLDRRKNPRLRPAKPLLESTLRLPERRMSFPSPDFEAKIAAPETLAARVAALPRPLVFTNGCFDILHRGHVTYLAQARAQGAAMIVALNTDGSVKRLGKGDERPINRLEDRLAVMAALACVDLVTWFDEDTPIARVLDCTPDVLVKGGDWPVEKIVGATETLARGGKVLSIPFIHERSTTALVDKIRRL
jgi:rfaE bifunctional protein nucleotidyltransferase chain/domain